MEAMAKTGALVAVDEATLPTPGGNVAIQVRLMAIASVARFHGVDLDRNDLRVEAETSAPAALATWLRDGGLWAKGVRLSPEATARADLGPDRPAAE